MTTNININSRDLVGVAAAWKLPDLLWTLFVIVAGSTAAYMVFFKPVPSETKRFLYLHDVCRSTTNLTVEGCTRQVRMQLYRESSN